jgi:hypothetical protein
MIAGTTRSDPPAHCPASWPACGNVSAHMQHGRSTVWAVSKIGVSQLCSPVCTLVGCCADAASVYLHPTDRQEHASDSTKQQRLVRSLNSEKLTPRCAPSKQCSYMPSAILQPPSLPTAAELALWNAAILILEMYTHPPYEVPTVGHSFSNASMCSLWSQLTPHMYNLGYTCHSPPRRKSPFSNALGVPLYRAEPTQPAPPPPPPLHTHLYMSGK